MKEIIEIEANTHRIQVVPIQKGKKSKTWSIFTEATSEEIMGEIKKALRGGN